MRMFGLKSCDTCRKARKALPEAEFVDVREQGVPASVLEAALETFGDALINTRSTTWRALSDEDRARASLALLQAHPTVMKRPLIKTDETYH
ncbi:MAG: ArsC/Spx/MgsR family protein, partial [Pseudomonadota bacterium]